MARIRSIHPQLWTDEAFVSLSVVARLFMIGLWSEADDYGLFEWKPVTLKMRLAPADNLDAPAIMGELSDAKFIIQFERDGKPYGVVKNFRKWQRPQKPSAPIIAIDDWIKTTIALVEPKADEPTQPLREHYDSPTGIENPMKDEGCRVEEEEPHSLRSCGVSAPEEQKPKKRTIFEILSGCLTAQTARDLIELRNKLKKPFTERSAEMLVDEFRTYGDAEQAALLMIKHSWRGFNPTWAGVPPPRDAHAPDQQVAGFYAAAGSPQLEAWQTHRHRTEGRFYPTDAKGGWRFPSEFPPLSDERAA